MQHGPPRKINKKKFGEWRADQIPISTQDFERIPELLSDYDKIELGDPERNTGRPSVVYAKTYPDGVLYGVEVVIEDDKKMHYKTGWKKKLKKAAAVSVGCTSLLTITPKAQNPCDAANYTTPDF